MKPVVVIGGLNMDIHMASPDSPFVTGTSNPSSMSIKSGGVARNIAVNLSMLGTPVILLGVVGDDDFGRLVRSSVSHAGIDPVTIQIVSGSRTGTYVALLGPRGELFTAASDMQIMETITPDWISDERETIQAASLVVADCNLAGSSLDALAGICEECGLPLVVDPVSVAKAGRLGGLRSTVEIVTPDEAEWEVCRSVDRFRHSVVTSGANGARWTDHQSGATVCVPAATATAVDVTGAGDAFASGLVAGLRTGASMPVALRFASAVAARVVSQESNTIDLVQAAALMTELEELNK